MQKKSNPIFKGVLWLTLSLVLTILFAFFIPGHSLLNDTVDLRLHDTFFFFALVYFDSTFFLYNIYSSFNCNVQKKVYWTVCKLGFAYFGINTNYHIDISNKIIHGIFVQLDFISTFISIGSWQSTSNGRRPNNKSYSQFFDSNANNNFKYTYFLCLSLRDTKAKGKIIFFV